MIQAFFGKYTYLFLDIISIFFPLVFSFHKKVHFVTKWWRLFPAMIVGATVFLIWDEMFTQRGVWSFSEQYIMGIYIGHLPVEEWMFFICIPFSCFFIYECVKAYFPDIELNVPVINVVFIGFLFIIGIPNYHRIYTFVTFVGAGVMLIIHILIFKKRYLTHFYVMWVIHLIPLFIINGFLTGIPVVMYDDEQNLGIRIGTVPLEDSFYSMFLLLLGLTVYEGLNELKKLRTAKA